MSMAINLGRVRIYNEEFLSIKSQSFDHVVLQGHVNYFSCCITTITRTMGTKLGKVVTYCKKLQPVKSHNSLNTWSREVT